MHHSTEELPTLSNVSAADELQNSTEVLRLSLGELRRRLNPLARGLERNLSPSR